MNTPEALQTVKLTMQLMKAKTPDSAIVRALEEQGFSSGQAADIISSVRSGFKSGVQALLLDSKIQPEGDDYFRIAFGIGKAAMRKQSIGWILLRTLSPLLLVVAVIAFIIWRYFC